MTSALILLVVLIGSVTGVRLWQVRRLTHRLRAVRMANVTNPQQPARKG
ncbi:MAG: hypothetical protein R2815_13150 [Flavobacteriales bacterium]